MVENLRLYFIALCFAQILWSLIKVERVYQYPCFMAAIFISFILPQINPLLKVLLPSLDEGAYIRVLVMACLCVAMGWVGYRVKPRLQWLQRLQIPLDDQKLFHVAILFTIIGYLCAALTAAYFATWSGGGQLSGAGTIYIFFGQLIYLAFPIFLMQLLSRPTRLILSPSTLLPLVGTVVSVFPIVQTVLAGRRQPTVTFMVIVGLSFFLQRRLLPPRWAVIALIAMGGYLIPLIAQLRAEFWQLLFSGDWQALQTAVEISTTKLQEGENLDLRNAAVLMDSVSRTGEFGWGTSFWDAVVFQFVPGQLVGLDFKRSLQFNWVPIQQIYQNYGYSSYVGSVITGIGDAFTEYWYFGCLIFALLGYLFKHLWISSVYFGSRVAALLMISLISPAMVSVSHGIGRFCQEAVFNIGAVWLIVAYARVRHSIPTPIPDPSTPTL
ncbi:MAG: hypothetical protein ACOYMP_14025 [Nodosilinea sp.]